MLQEKITAYFETYKAAQEALDDLKNSGFHRSYIDLNDHDTDINSQTNQPGTASSNNSLASLVLRSGNHAVSLGKAPLAAASPMASGLGDFEEIYGFRCKLIVETEPENIDQVKRIINNREGSMDNPNVDLPKGLENVGLEEVILSNIDHV